ncbi:MAG: ATP-dependent RNA helicase DBP2 [Amphiamblys sp. WSBS2006]|nr:MAG: ATP-dependent RNA helicase DBP2 [Amphiamblys sp. WSBS2006]
MDRRNRSFSQQPRRFAPRRDRLDAEQPLGAERKELVPPVYTEHPDVAALPQRTVDEYRALHQISISGADSPKPVLDVAHAGFPRAVEALLHRNKITKTTPIQAQGWPAALAGRNLVGIAQTGSGKTLSFLLPAFQHIIAQKGRDRPAVPFALALAPTRELALQIQAVANEYGRPLGIRTTCVFGGAPRSMQARELGSGTDMVIATPGRLIDFIDSGEISLVNCSFLVLDEADRMLDMGFESQLRRIVPSIRDDRQTLMWSATWPRDVRRLADDFLGKNTVMLRVGGDTLTANKKIAQKFVFCRPFEKEKSLLKTLFDLYDAAEEKKEGFPKTIVFVNTKRVADEIAAKLKDDDWPVGTIHGDKSQDQRERILNSFRSGKFSVLVATEVAARGLDIEDIRVVVNYDFPKTTEDYVHRIGRTARGNSAEGTAYSFFTSADAGNARDVTKLLKEAQQPVPEEIVNMCNSGRGGSQNSSYRRQGPSNPRFSRDSYSRNDTSRRNDRFDRR